MPPVCRAFELKSQATFLNDWEDKKLSESILSFFVVNWPASLSGLVIRIIMPLYLGSGWTPVLYAFTCLTCSNSIISYLEIQVLEVKEIH